MQFIYDGEYYKAIKITGPNHNMLGVSLGDPSRLEIIALPGRPNEPAKIFERDMTHQVLSCVEEVNAELGCHYALGKIQYVVSDTPSTTVYRELIREILYRVHEGNGFVQVNAN